MRNLNLPALEQALEEGSFLERERTVQFAAKLTIVLYDGGVTNVVSSKLFAALNQRPLSRTERSSHNG